MRGGEYTELRSFVAVAERGSFARAATHLGVTPSALSQTIRGLEDRLGVRLLNRTTRSVAPTDAGSRLLDRIAPAFADLEAAVADVRTLGDRPSGSLRINASQSATAVYLAPLVGRFLNAYPAITLEIVADDTLVDIVSGRFDAGVRFGERLERDMIAIRLSGDLEMAIVAAPDYLARHGTPMVPQELRHHRCINFRLPTNQNLYRWEFERDGAMLEVPVDGPLIANHTSVQIQAALDGVGIGYPMLDDVRDHIAAGRLVHILRDWTPPFPGFYLYYPKHRQTLPALRAFIDFFSPSRGPAGGP
ncbi:LysR family transcriptional regulator [Humitalea sp. 24SJ18S-53]|uniref:LysR family transcriptional regulator n=1 Tax=Humitalea sp. 24SJ18S-53 TaxID=3422307 RepID=UPI003D67B2A7